MSDRALGRATLERQLLLQRRDRPVLDTVSALVGLQAQEPGDPYIALWSRLDRFDPDVLSGLLVDRSVVRIVVMRATVHLVTADDALALRPLMQRVLDAELARHPQFSPALVGVDTTPVLATARELLAAEPLSGTALRAALAERFPDLDAAALAYAARNLIPLVQVPPRGLWGKSAQVRSAPLETWVGRPLAADPSIDSIVLRYLGAFGPASAADVTTWCRLPAMGEVIARLRPQLRTFRNERGRELVDLPDAPRPDPDTPAPPRFLPMYDNVLLSHADRHRFMTDDQRRRAYSASPPVFGSVLHDGTVAGTWRTARDKSAGAATLTVTLIDRLPKRARTAIAAEGRRFLRFSAADATSHDVDVREPDPEPV